MSAPPRGPSPRLIILGLDGATFDLLLPWAQAGHLPHLAGLLQQGAHAPLQSVIPPLTPCAWTTMLTGTNPGRHGIYDFVLPRPGSYGRRLATAADRATPPLWLLANEAGCSAGVVNVPTSYPPDELQGYMISGMMGAPDFTPAVVRPEALFAEIKSAVGEFIMQPVNRTSRGYDRAALDAQIANREATFTYLLDHYPTDLFIGVVNYTDHLEHWFFTDRACPGSEAEFADMILYGYQAADRLLGLVLQRLSPEGHVLVVSDHGAGPLEAYLNIDRLLVEAGLLTFRGSLAVSRGGWRRRLAGKLPDWLRERLPRGWRRRALEQVRHEYESEIDWSQTRVFRRGSGYGLSLNLQGREPEGVIPAGEYEAVREQIITTLQNIWASCPALGELEIYRREELYHGPRLAEAPDLVLAPAGFAIEPTPSPHPAAGVVVTPADMHRFGAPKRYKVGSHRLEGILIAAGPRIAPGACLAGPRLADITPTALQLLGVKVPEGLDGRVLDELLTAGVT
jgi:predicted AlkP superfamily phosphohydrolase/phosphomutase